MHWEVERKFRVADVADVEQRLARLGATIEPPIEQCDQYFAHPARDFAKTDEALRIRSVGEENFLTYKGPKVDATTKTRRELELPLMLGAAAAADFAELLAALGFRPVLEVRKSRRTASVAWHGYHVEAALDDVAGLGQFVELELQAAADGIDAASDALDSLAADLGLSADERRSYLELLLAAGGAVGGK